IIVTGMRAGADQALIIHREPLSPRVERVLRTSKLLRRLRTLDFANVPRFEPASPASWQKISGFIEDDFLWLPWNWVTNKYGLTNLNLVQARPQNWDRPLRLTRFGVLSFHQPKRLPSVLSEGCAVTSQTSV